MQEWIARITCVALFALPSLGCTLNQEGNLAAATTGDLGRPARRGSPTARLAEACGATGELTAAATTKIRRAPYLQQVTSGSALIGWLSAAGDDERVEVTLPDGSPVAIAAGEVDRSVRETGDHQMWAQVEGLSPDTTYCYTLVSGTRRLSERIGFSTAPTADSTRPIGFLAFGDSGAGGSDQRALRDVMDDVPFELIVHTGDLAYDTGKLAEFESNVFGVYAGLLRHLPMFPAAGNHEYDTMQGAPFRDVFNLPGDSGEKWYSYDWGRIHFVALDTEASYRTQAEWLDDDLARTELPWKIVYLHRPPYSSGHHGSDTGLRTVLAPVLEKHGVQLVLAGHDHNYERIEPQNGVAYVVTGGGGKGTRTVGTSAFTALSSAVIHLLYVEVGIDELVLHAIDGTGTEFDSVVIRRDRR